MGLLHFKITVMWLFPHTLFFKVQYFAAGFYVQEEKVQYFLKYYVLITCSSVIYTWKKTLKIPVVLIIKHELM